MGVHDWGFFFVLPGGGDMEVFGLMADFVPGIKPDLACGWLEKGTRRPGR